MMIIQLHKTLVIFNVFKSELPQKVNSFSCNSNFEFQIIICEHSKDEMP